MTNEKLEGEIAALIRRHASYGLFDSFLAQFFFWVAVIGSGLASILAATNKFDPSVVAVLAALPAFVLLIDNTFKYEARSVWHRKFARELTALQRDLDFMEAQPKDVAKRLTELEKEMDEIYPAMGRGFSQPLQRQRPNAVDSSTRPRT